MNEAQGSPDEDDTEFDREWDSLPLDDLDAQRLAVALGLEWMDPLDRHVARALLSRWGKSKTALDSRISELEQDQARRGVDRAIASIAGRFVPAPDSDSESTVNRRSLVCSLGLLLKIAARRPDTRDRLLALVARYPKQADVIRDIADGARVDRVTVLRALEALWSPRSANAEGEAEAPTVTKAAVEEGAEAPPAIDLPIIAFRFSSDPDGTEEAECEQLGLKLVGHQASVLRALVEAEGPILGGTDLATRASIAVDNSARTAYTRLRDKIRGKTGRTGYFEEARGRYEARRIERDG